VPLDCSLPLPYLLPPVKDRGKNQTGRGGEVVPPGLPSRMRGPRSGRKDPAAGRRRCGGASVLYGSGVTGGEQQGVARWGGAPTGARPAKTAVKRRGGGASRPGRVRHQSPATMMKASGPSRHPGGSIRSRRRRGWTGGRRAVLTFSDTNLSWHDLQTGKLLPRQTLSGNLIIMPLVSLQNMRYFF